MNQSRRCFFAALFSFLLLATPAFAGGKSNTYIKVQNNRATPIGAIVNPSQEIVDAASNGTLTLQQFQSAGGKIINPSSSASFKVNAGNNTVAFGDENLANFGSDTVNVRKGNTFIFNVN